MSSKKHGTDITHIVFLSFIVPLLLFSIVNTWLSIFNQSYAINDRLLLGASLYAIIFSLLTSSYVKGKFKVIGLFILPVLVYYLALLAAEHKVDLDGVNNGLSLIALSISIMILPFRTRQEEIEKEMNLKNIEEISDLKKQIEEIHNSNKEQRIKSNAQFKEIIDNAQADHKFEREEKRKVIEQNKKLNEEIGSLKEKLHAIEINMMDLDRHFKYEKNQMEYEFGVTSGNDAMEIERLKEEISKLKEDA